MSLSMVNLAADAALDYDSPDYRSAYSRINGLVIEGEQEACNNYLALAELMPEYRDEFSQAARMERRHQRGFQACGQRLGIEADRHWAQAVFAGLHGQFAAAAAQQQTVPCLLIQCFVVECLAIAFYNVYAPVADRLSRQIAETVIQDEQSHLRFGQTWFREHFQAVKAELQAVNNQVLPLAWEILAQMTPDAAQLGIDPEALAEEFTIQYGEALEEIGFSFPEVMRLSADRAWAA